MSGFVPARGEIWLADLNPTPHPEEIGKVRPCLVVSDTEYNRGPMKRVVVVPVTTKLRDINWRVRLVPDEGGIRQASQIVCDMVRYISKKRLKEPWGIVTQETMKEVEDRLVVLLDL